MQNKNNKTSLLIKEHKIVVFVSAHFFYICNFKIFLSFFLFTDLVENCCHTTHYCPERQLHCCRAEAARTMLQSSPQFATIDNLTIFCFLFSFAFFKPKLFFFPLFYWTKTVCVLRSYLDAAKMLFRDFVVAILIVNVTTNNLILVVLIITFFSE